MFDRALSFFQKFLTLSIIQNQMVGIFTCSDIRPWIFHWCYLNRTFSPVITTMQTCSKSLCQHISMLSTQNLKGHGGFGCLENPFNPSVTLQVQLSASYVWLSKFFVFAESQRVENSLQQWLGPDHWAIRNGTPPPLQPKVSETFLQVMVVNS